MRVKSRLLRLVQALIPPLVAFLTSLGWVKSNPVAAVLLGMVSVYYVVYMTVGRFDTEYWRFRRTFVLMVSVAGFLSALNIILYLVVEETTKARINLPGIIGFTIACAVSGMIALSELRKGNPDAKWKAMNAGRLVLMFAISAAALALLYLILSFVFSLITPTLGPKAPRLMTEHIRFNYTNIPPAYSTVPGGQMVEDESMKEDKPVQEFEKEEEEGFPWVPVCIIAAVVVAGAVAFLIIRKRRKKTEEPIVVRTPEEQAQLDKIERIRAVYRQYIAFVRKEGADLTKGSTSEDILESSKDLREESDLTEDESKLREIYIRARYGNPDGISEEDVSEACRLLEKITQKS
ncbi:MAG: hypothetical protein IIU49_04390 [Spirochaetales bacterium]|nr:hypothetical protein [Spirochaetales bacterium]